MNVDTPIRGHVDTFQIGVTGGIGSGKTTVCKLFETLGIPVYYADDRAKKIMVESPDLIKGIKSAFGEEAYTSDGELNRLYLAQIVFNDQSKLATLNGLVHPAVHADGQAWIAAQKNAPYALNEAALMVESGGYKRMDKLISVFAPQEIRIQRVMQRDGSTKEQVLARLNKQLPEIEKIKVADFVINNDGNHSLIKQVYAIHQHLLRLS